MKRWSLPLLAAAAVFVASSSLAAPGADDASAQQQMFAEHARLWARLRPADLRLLMALAWRLRDTLRLDARLPQDVGPVIAKASRGRLSSDEVAVLADDASVELAEMGPRMTDMPTNYSLDYLQLESAMQDENRTYTMVSNIMKTKHDTVKSTIANIR